MPALFFDDKISLIDDSGATTNPTVNQGGRVFNVVSGSITNGIHTAAADEAAGNMGSYGLFYPDLGILIFNGPILILKNELLQIPRSRQ